ncbi:MAG: SUF system NifU family Fe-S cluster assembly protein [Tissierellia bacterium]|nr:SUF system NifU family Fe-S cluster assembly protein [Tissierellia bacterium]
MDLKDIYTELILEESRNPRNRRHLEDPSMVELGHNPSCGDEITLEIKLEGDTLTDISYNGHGCAISQASTSIMCDLTRKKTKEETLYLCHLFLGMVKGEIETEEELEVLEDGMVFQNMKNLPARIKCAVLPWYTLKNMLESGNTSESFRQ